MAHGSKKWITAYDGKIKRSNDRTKKDYYRDLKDWDDWQYGRWNRHLNKMVETKDFCPQCKHVAKPIRVEEKERRAYNDALHAEYEALHGAADREWSKYRRAAGSYVVDHLGKIHYKEPFVPYPKSKEPPRYYEWVRGRDVRSYTTYDARSYLCYKHERMYEVKNNGEFWRSQYPRHHTGARRAEYKQYRTKVKNLMQKAKYDEEYYDDIFDKKNGWLD